MRQFQPQIKPIFPQKVLLLLMSSFCLLPFADARRCTLNVSNLTETQSYGIPKIEAILAQNFDLIHGIEQESDYVLDVRYFGNEKEQTITLILFQDYPRNIYNESITYTSIFGARRGPWERKFLLDLVKAVKAPPLDCGLYPEQDQMNSELEE